MAEVVINTNLRESRWLVDEYYKPYVRKSGFDTYMGQGTDAIFRTFAPGTTDGGKDIIVPLVGTIKNGGVSGSQVLEGNEVDLETYADKISPVWRRNAVKVPKSSQYYSNLDILKVAGPSLRDWAARHILKQGIIDNLQGIVVPGAVNVDGFATPDAVVRYSDSTASQKNAFLVNNADRVLFGVDPANASSGVWATAAATVDSTNDRMSTLVLEQARILAQATSDMAATGPAIVPYMLEDGEEWYVCFVNRLQMRDLRRDASMTDALKYAQERGKDNPLFRAGDLVWRDIIVREVADIPIIAGIGNGGANVALATLCGQSAVGIGWGQEPRLISDTKQDYEFRPAKAIEELIGIKKTSFAGVQYSTVTIMTTATPL